MNNLLRANFARMVKDKSFWNCIICSVLFSVFNCIVAYHDMMKYGTSYNLEDFIFKIFILTGFFVAVFCSLYIGTEYSDGTIRNKLVVGQTRTAIYLADSVTVIAANILISLAYMLVTLLIGFPLFGGFILDLKTLLYYLFVGMLMVIAISSLCTLLSMLNQNKAHTAVISILLVVIALVYISAVSSNLNASEFYPHYITNSEGNIESKELVLNPNYPRGFQRDYYEFMVDLVPMGQGMQLAALDVARPGRLLVLSLLITILSNGVGILFFGRKDLK